MTKIIVRRFLSCKSMQTKQEWKLDGGLYSQTLLNRISDMKLVDMSDTASDDDSDVKWE